MDNFEVLADELKIEVVKEIHRATMIMPRREAGKKGLGLMKKFMLAFKTARRFGAGVSLPLHLTMTSSSSAAADDGGGDDDDNDEYTNLCLVSLLPALSIRMPPRLPSPSPSPSFTIPLL